MKKRFKKHAKAVDLSFSYDIIDKNEITMTVISHGGRSKNMKANIHPEQKECKVICACGNEFTTMSTKETMNIEVCSECHPFYTGTQGKSKKTGKVEKFNKKYNLGK